MPNGLLPVGHIVAFVDALSVGANLDVMNGVQPFVLKPQLNQLTRGVATRLLRLGRITTTTCARKNIGIGVVEILVVAKEVVNDELLFANVGSGAGATATHLLVQDGAAHATAHHQMQNFATVKTGVEHADADGDHR